MITYLHNSSNGMNEFYCFISLCFHVFVYRMSNTIETLDWNDTFLNIDHLKASFPGHEFEITTEDVSKCIPPFRQVILETYL